MRKTVFFLGLFLAIACQKTDDVLNGKLQLSGVVTDSINGKPLDGARVYLSELLNSADSSSFFSKEVFTDEKGNYQFNDLSSKSYNIDFSLSGYESKIKKIKIDNENIIYNISLSNVPINISDGKSWAYHYTDKVYITNSKNQLFVSKDNCKSWSFISTLAFNTDMFMSIDDSNLYASDLSKIFISNDNGKTWIRLPDKGEGGAFNSFDVDIKTKEVYASTGWGGLFHYNGNKWSKIYEIPSDNVSESVCVDQNSNVYFAVYLFAVYKSIDKGLNWLNTSSWSGGSSPEVLYVTDDDIVLMGTYWSGLYKLVGTDWIEITNGLPINRGVRAVVAKGINYYCFVSDQMGNEGLYFSSDKGQNWISCKYNLSNSDIENLVNLSINKSGLLIITVLGKGHFYLNKDSLTWDLIK